MQTIFLKIHSKEKTESENQHIVCMAIILLHFPNLYYSEIEDTMSYSVTKRTCNFILLH